MGPRSAEGWSEAPVGPVVSAPGPVLCLARNPRVSSWSAFSQLAGKGQTEPKNGQGERGVAR